MYDMRVKEYPAEIQRAFLLETQKYRNFIYVGIRPPITISLEAIQNSHPEDLFSFEQSSNISKSYDREAILFWDSVSRGNYNLFYDYYIFPEGFNYKKITQDGEVFHV